MVVQEVVQHIETELEQAEIAAICAVNDTMEAGFHGQGTEIDDPEISQASSQHQMSDTSRVRQMAFVKMEATAFLVREEGFDVKSFLISLAGFIRRVEIGDEVDGVFAAPPPPANR